MGFHVFTCRILGERTETLPPSHQLTHRGALGLRGAPPGQPPCTVGAVLFYSSDRASRISAGSDGCTCHETAVSDVGLFTQHLCISLQSSSYLRLCLSVCLTVCVHVCVCVCVGLCDYMAFSGGDSLRVRLRVCVCVGVPVTRATQSNSVVCYDIIHRVEGFRTISYHPACSQLNMESLV